MASPAMFISMCVHMQVYVMHAKELCNIIGLYILEISYLDPLA